MNARRRFWLWIAGGALVTPLLLPLLFIVGVFCVQVGYELMGFHAFVFNGEKIAQIAIQNSDPRECYKIRVVFAINTNTYFEEQYCIYTYAKLTRDPSACELLMPGEYGWSCLGAVESELWKGIGCGNTEKKINCGAYGVFSSNLGVNDCNVYDKQILRDWCHEERSATLQNVHECADISPDPPALQEICERRYAFKMKDPSLCLKMSDEKRRALCEMEINAWQQYSENWSFAQ